jgi:hypothetical protein
MMLFRRGNRKKSSHRTPLTWRPRAPGQGRSGEKRKKERRAIKDTNGKKIKNGKRKENGGNSQN